MICIRSQQQQQTQQKHARASTVALYDRWHRPGVFPLSEEVHPVCAGTSIRADARAYHAPVTLPDGKCIIRVWLRWHDAPTVVPAVDLHAASKSVIVHGLLEAMCGGDVRFLDCVALLLRSWFGVDARIVVGEDPPPPPPTRGDRRRPNIRTRIELWNATGAQVVIQPRRTTVPLAIDAAAMAASWLPQYCRGLLARKGLPPAIPAGTFS